jgi:hypothetical protein
LRSGHPAIQQLAAAAGRLALHGGGLKGLDEVAVSLDPDLGDNGAVLGTTLGCGHPGLEQAQELAVELRHVGQPRQAQDRLERLLQRSTTDAQPLARIEQPGRELHRPAPGAGRQKCRHPRRGQGVEPREQGLHLLRAHQAPCRWL